MNTYILVETKTRHELLVLHAQILERHAQLVDLVAHILLLGFGQRQHLVRLRFLLVLLDAVGERIVNVCDLLHGRLADDVDLGLARLVQIVGARIKQHAEYVAVSTGREQEFFVKAQANVSHVAVLDVVEAVRPVARRLLDRARLRLVDAVSSYSAVLLAHQRVRLLLTVTIKSKMFTFHFTFHFTCLDQGLVVTQDSKSRLLLVQVL